MELEVNLVSLSLFPKPPKWIHVLHSDGPGQSHNGQESIPRRHKYYNPGSTLISSEWLYKIRGLTWKY